MNRSEEQSIDSPPMPVVIAMPTKDAEQTIHDRLLVYLPMLTLPSHLVARVEAAARKKYVL